MINGRISMWIDALESRPAFPTVSEAVTSDYAIVGGGLSGLWTAYHLKSMLPEASVAVCEANRIASGASGRACGWLSGKPIGVRDQLARVSGAAAVTRTEQLVRDSLDSIVEMFARLGKDIGAHKGGTLQVARSASEAARIRDSVAASHKWGVPEDHMRLLDAAETRARVDVSEAAAGAFSPDMVRVDPARMTIALAEIVHDMGVAIYEDSRVAPRPGAVPTANGHPIRAGRFAIATEGYTSMLPGMKRTMLPMNSSLIATRPLSEAEWKRIGWSDSEGLSGSAHTYFYAARTPDDRIAIGGRGKPYRFGSGFDRNGAVDTATVSSLQSMLQDLFPQIRPDISYTWCGVIGVTRDWSPFVHRNPADGSVVMGGYAGQGLTAAHLSGRIAASLLTDTHDEYAELPWVRNIPRDWEPEPLRWIGANGLYRVYSLADVLERRSGKEQTSVVAKAADRIAGRSTAPARRVIGSEKSR